MGLALADEGASGRVRECTTNGPKHGGLARVVRACDYRQAGNTNRGVFDRLKVTDTNTERHGLSYADALPESTLFRRAAHHRRRFCALGGT